MRLVNFPLDPRPTGPLVLVLELENHMALTAVRGLGQEGIPCLGVSYEGVSFGCRSRYLRGYAAWIPSDEEELAETTLDLIRKARPDFVMAASERVMTVMNAYRGRLPVGTKLLFAEQDVLEGAFDKGRTLRTAKEIGVPVPRSWPGEPILRSGKPPRTLRFPVVLKPPAPYTKSPWREMDFRYGYCSSAKSLVETLRRYEKAPYLPLVQEYCRGRGVGIELCMHRGKVVAAFQHERLREMPPSGGVSSMRRSTPLDPEMLEHSVRLLKALHWEGLAMVEYRRDDRSGRYWLMEVNGRLWGSISLPLRCGVNFPLLLLQSMGLERRPTVPLGSYPAGVCCRALSLDLRWLLTMLTTRNDNPASDDGLTRRAALLGGFFRDFLRPTCYDLEWGDDLRPALHYWRDRMRVALRRATGRHPASFAESNGSDRFFPRAREIGSRFDR